MEVQFPSPPQFNYIRQLQATKEDFQALAACYNTFNDPDSWPSGFGGGMVHTAETVARSFEGKTLEAHFVAVSPKNPDQIIGVCFCSRATIRPNTWYVALLGVDPAFQGQGFGKALLLKALEFALERQCTQLFLNTWSGNLKAMPLYKRQGFKWRPGTDVLMESYIPAMLTFPAFKSFFSRHCWYDVFKATITQVPDEEFEEKMWIYRYHFEAKNERLDVWIDRAIGKISGFSLFSSDIKLTCKLQTRNSECYIGMEKCIFSLQLENLDDSAKEVKLVISTSSFIEVDDKKEKIVLQLEPGEKKIIKFEGRVKPTALEQNLKENPYQYTRTEFQVQVSIDKLTFPLTAGVIPRRAVLVRSLQDLPMFKPMTHGYIDVEFVNRINKPISIQFTAKGSNHIIIGKERAKVQLSELDAMISLPIEVKEIEKAAIEEITINVSTADDNGQLHEAKIPVLILGDENALKHETPEKITLVNKDVSLIVHVEPLVLNSALFASRKRNIPKQRCAPLILGYPFDVEGSEFHSRKLEHQVHEVKEGMKILSTGTSEVKKGIIFTREILVPHRGEMIEIRYSLKNQSEKRYKNLGVLLEVWNSKHQEANEVILPLVGGIRKISADQMMKISEVDVSLLEEGWICLCHNEGVMGILFDQKSVSSIKRDYIFYMFEQRVNNLNPGETASTQPIRIVFAATWQEIQQEWKNWLREVAWASPEDEVMKTPRNLLQLGLTTTEDDGTPAAAVILDEANPRLFISLQSPLKINLRGSLTISGFEQLTIRPRDVKINVSQVTRWTHPIQVSIDSKERIHLGRLHRDDGDRVSEFSLSIAVHDSRGSVTISSSKDKDDLESFELNNGQLLFRASHQFSAALFYLGTVKEPAHNYLKTFYPEVRPFLYHDRFYGGVLPIVLPIGKWRSREFHQLRFTARKIKKQQWAGVVFESEIIKYDESLKGLKAIISYLTLPESPLLHVDLEVKNESKTKRKFKPRIIANLNTSGTPNDIFYCEGVDGHLQVMHSSDHGASIGPSVNQHVAVHVPSHAPYSLGMALWSSRPRARVEVLNTNLSLAFFFSEQPLVNIAPDESHHLRALFILAKDHQAIFPFGTVDLSKLTCPDMKMLDGSKDRR